MDTIDVIGNQVFGIRNADFSAKTAIKPLEDLIPDDVTIQVLVQCRAELIERTYECLAGVKRAKQVVVPCPTALSRLM